MVLHRQHIAGWARPCHGENARVAVVWRWAEAIVFDDIARILLAQHQYQVRAAIPVEIAFDAGLQRPAVGHEAGSSGSLGRQRRVLHRRQVERMGRARQGAQQCCKGVGAHRGLHGRGQRG